MAARYVVMRLSDALARCTPLLMLALLARR
jgi:hypothetical protein